jgi:hypothetical protein
MINSKDVGKLAEIQRLMDEAYKHYFEHSDGYCKSSEGAVTVGFGTFFDRRDGNAGINYVEIYSYVMGENRLNTFKSVDEALETVRRWHKEEMDHDYSEEV